MHLFQIKNLFLLQIALLPYLQICIGVNIIPDTSAAPDLAEFAATAVATLTAWYPEIFKALWSPTIMPIPTIFLYFDPFFPGIAFSDLPTAKITAGAMYFRENEDDVGALIHELAHLLQQYTNEPPSWVKDGIADYVRYYIFDPAMAPLKPPPGSSFNDSFGVAAYFLNWVNKNKYDYTIYYINKDSREGMYSDSIFKRLTGRTLNQNYQDMLRSPPSPPPSTPAPTPTTPPTPPTPPPPA